MSPFSFWDMTLAEVSSSIAGRMELDKMSWNHTASLMAMYANSKSPKGRTFTSEQFHPYSQMQSKAEIKETADALLEKFKTI